jgi:hypothetical protein
MRIGLSFVAFKRSSPVELGPKSISRPDRRYQGWFSSNRAWNLSSELLAEGLISPAMKSMPYRSDMPRNPTFTFKAQEAR